MRTRVANDVVGGSAVRAAWVALACAALLTTMCGCAGGVGAKRGEPAVESLHVLSVPVAVDFDGVPGPDGFALTLFAKGPKSAKGVPLPEGRLELLMYDGLFSEEKSSSSEPLRVWRYTRSDLKLHSGKSAVGTGYRFTLRWENARPTQRQITLLARFTPEGGRMIKSAPSAVAVTVK